MNSLKMNYLRYLFLMIFVFVIGTACQFNQFGSQGQGLSPSNDHDQPLATAVAQEPAAGICGSSEGELAVVTIYPGIPDPRCVLVGPDQMLKVVNRQPENIQVSLAKFEVSIEPDGEHIFRIPFGEFLALGVHYIEVSPCCGGSIYLKVDQ